MKRYSLVAIFALLAFASTVNSAVVNKTDKISDDPEELTPLSTPNLFWDDWEDWDTWEPRRGGMSQWFPYYRCGYDNDGSVVYVLESGKWNIKNLTQMPDEVVEEFWKYNEQLTRRVEMDAANNSNQGVVFIHDWDEFSLTNYATSASLELALKIFTSLFRFNQAIKYGFLINVNYPAEIFIDLSRPFMGKIMEKLELYGPQSRKWKPMLLRNIPSDQLPPKYGGDRNWKPLPFHVTDGNSL